MVRRSLPLCVGIAAIAIAAGTPLVSPLVAQSALAQLGLTGNAAQSFLFEELKSDTPGGRRTAIAVVGHRAFYKLPAAARGPAATGLFAWARAYVNSPAFKTRYAQFRRDANPVDERSTTVSVDAQVAAQIAEMLAAVEETRKIAATLPPADRDRMLAQVKAQEVQIRDPAFAERLRQGLGVEQAGRVADTAASTAAFNAQYPADPNQIIARRLRAFLDDTADADFSAPVIRLTGGPDGMEFIDPVHRAKSVTWQLAVLAGAETTRAARTGADAWLKELTTR